MTLKRADLVKHLINERGFAKADAVAFVEYCFAEMKAALLKGESLQLSGFGNFNLLDKQPRMGRNPRTGEAHEICARRVVSFRAGKKLRAKLLAAASLDLKP